MAPPGRYELPDWPRAHGEPLGRGRLRETPEDFRVTEVLGFTPDGDGDHDYLYVEKRGVNTRDAARILARHAGVRERDVGYSGLKDRRAVARQWFSVPRRQGAGTNWRGFAHEGIVIMEASRHRRKLRRGVHRANRFRLRLATGAVDRHAYAARIDVIAVNGVPNYFGEQRFGRGGSNLVSAERLFAGVRLSRHARSMALSAARALLFNEILAARVVDGSWGRLLPGDVANLDGTGSLFSVEDVDAALADRAAALEIHPTGALWGKTGDAVNAPREGEAFAAAKHPSLARGLAEWTDAGRRALRLAVRQIDWTPVGGGVELAFELGRGGYATAVVREMISYPA